MDKKRKKELVRQFKEREWVEARKKVSLRREQLLSLLAHVEEQLASGASCDHTLRMTRQWARQSNLDEEKIVASVKEFGGFCDCEVCYNLTPDKFGWAEEGG